MYACVRIQCFFFFLNLNSICSTAAFFWYTEGVKILVFVDEMRDDMQVHQDSVIFLLMNHFSDFVLDLFAAHYFYVECFIGFAWLPYVSNHVYQIQFNGSQMHRNAEIYVMIMLVSNKLIHTVRYFHFGLEYRSKEEWNGREESNWINNIIFCWSIRAHIQNRVCASFGWKTPEKSNKFDLHVKCNILAFPFTR